MRNLTYSCLSTGTFAELIEVNEELADTDSILGIFFCKSAAPLGL